MTDSADQQLIVELARDLVVQIAPQELPLFRPISQAYLHNPERVLTGQGCKDDMLGFGLAEGVMLVTPVALAVMTEVVNFIAAEVKHTITAESSRLVGDLVKHMFTKFSLGESSDKLPLPLTPEQIAQVRRIAFAKARQLKLPEAQAALLADAVAGGLGITST